MIELSNYERKLLWYYNIMIGEQQEKELLELLGSSGEDMLDREIQKVAA
jgi:hypothetical protein